MAGQVPDRPSAGMRYRSLSNFYLADPRRIASQERDLGRWWSVGLHGPTYRAAWVRETGELYAARLGMPAEHDAVYVLGRGTDEELEAALDGWADVCPQPDSMTWLRHRARSLAQPQTPRAISRERRDLTLAGRRAQQAKATLAHTGRGATAITRRPVIPASDASDSSPSYATAPRPQTNATLFALVGATAGITAPVTALLLELG